MTVFPSVIVFDVNGALSGTGPVGQRFCDVGAPAYLATLWLATLLRDALELIRAPEAARTRRPLRVPRCRRHRCRSKQMHRTV
jgi:hypothetical protein